MKRAWLFAGAILLAACARAEREPMQVTPVPACECGSAAAAAAQPVVDPALMAFLSKAKALHGEADVAEDKKDPKGAIAALTRIFDGPAPTAPEADEVLADTRARLAELRAKTGDFDKAVADVNDGLLHAKKPSYFRGHLYEVMGSVEEKRAAQLAKSNASPADVEAARKRAIDASEAAVKIQDEVIQGAMGAPR